MAHPSTRQLLAEILLVAVAAVWGWTFVIVKDAVALYPVMPFLALRFALAAAVVGVGLLVARLMSRGRARVSRPADRGRRLTVLGGGVVMGALLGAGYIFQTLGLELTTASNAGFITGLFVVLVPPLQAVVWRSRPGADVILGAALAVLGLFLLSGGPSLWSGADGDMVVGDLLVFGCAVSFAAHILATGHYAGRADPALLTLVQLAAVAVLTGGLTVGGVAAGVAEPPGLPTDREVIFALVITAVFASAAAFYIQTYAQRHSQPARTAVILTMEPVFAGLFGYLLAGERLTPLGWLGAGFILAGMLVAELELLGRRKGLPTP